MAKTDKIIEAHSKAGTLAAVISQHRFDQSTEVAVDAIARGELGRLTTGIASIDWWRGQSYYDSGDWRGTWELDGGGAMMNQSVHTVDLLVATLAGTEPLRVDLETNRQAIAIITGAYESARTGKPATLKTLGEEWATSARAATRRLRAGC